MMNTWQVGKNEMRKPLVISAVLHVILFLVLMVTARPKPKLYTDKPLMVDLQQLTMPKMEEKVPEPVKEEVRTPLLEQIISKLRKTRNKLAAKDPSPTPTRRPRVAKTPTPGPAKPRSTPRIVPTMASVKGKQSIQVGDARFEYSYYLGSLQSELTRNWDPPVEAGLTGKQKEVTCAFRIDKGGVVSDIRVVKPSGRKALDDSAKLAIMRAAPFPEFPPDYKKGFLDVTVTFGAEQEWDRLK